MPAIIMVVLMAGAATFLYRAFVLLTVKENSTTVGRRAKDRVLAMGMRKRRSRAIVMLVCAVVCFLLMITVGIVLAHSGYAVCRPRQWGERAGSPGLPVGPVRWNASPDGTAFRNVFSRIGSMWT